MKITEEELNKFKELKKVSEDIVIKLGQINYQKLLLKLEEDYITNDIIKLDKDKTQITNELFQKYGKIDLNAETGEFSPID